MALLAHCQRAQLKLSNAILMEGAENVTRLDLLPWRTSIGFVIKNEFSTRSARREREIQSPARCPADAIVIVK